MSGACTGSAARSGIVLLGLMADKAVNAAGARTVCSTATRDFFITQVVTVVASSIYAFGFTY